MGRAIVKIVAFCLGLALVSCAPAPKNAADLVLTNARIYTVNDQAPWAEAIAIKGDSIVYVGDAAGAEVYVGEATVRTDLNGRLVLPGLIDGHTHPGMMNMAINVHRLPDAGHKNLLKAVKEYADSEPGDGWLKMSYWNIFEYLADGAPGPHKKDLDSVVPDRPVWITSLTGHSVWVNSKALEVLGVDENTPDPVPNVANYVRDENGELTGWIKEGAAWQFMGEQFPPDIPYMREGIDTFLSILTEHGITTVYDGGNKDYDDLVYTYLAELERAGKLPLRYEGTYAVYLPERRHQAVSEMKRFRKEYGGERLKFRTIKLFMDGISPELAAGMIRPFTSHPHEPGGTALSVEELRDWLLELHKEKFDLHVHTIGDLAVRRVLDAVEAAQNIVGDDFYPRVTLAHLEIIDPADWPRFKELGVSANFTPWWFGRAPAGAVLPMIGYDRSQNRHPAKDVIAAGGNVTFSSDDWGKRELTPFLGIQVGHTRQFPAEWDSEDGSAPETPHEMDPYSVSREEMVKGYTRSGAYPFRLENQIGSLEVGKLADLVVLNEDLFKMNNRAIHKIKPAAVMIEGKVIHGKLEVSQ